MWFSGWRDASTASSAKVEQTPADAPLEEAVLDVLLRRDGVAAGDGREACGRKGGGFRAPRGAGAGGGSRAALGSVRGPLAPARSQTGGTDAMGSSRFKRPPGAIFGHVPDAAAKLPTTSADRSFMMATAREQANYKRLSWCRAWTQIGFCARVPALTSALCYPCTNGDDAKEQ